MSTPTNKMDNDLVFQYNQEEEEDTISLSDFPSSTTDDHEHEDDDKLYRNEFSTFKGLTQSDQTDLFEFLSDQNSNKNMSHAEDIIFCGKLIPFKDQNTPKHHNPTPTHRNFHRRRSESLSELKSSNRSNSTQMIKMRNSRSLDYHKLSKTTSSDSPELQRDTSSGRGSARFEPSHHAKSLPKPKWYIMLFGNVRFPPEMDLRDIKHRQVRRTQSANLFPSVKLANKAPVNRKSTWGVLKVLSCRDDASVLVTTSLARMPQV